MTKKILFIFSILTVFVLLSFGLNDDDLIPTKNISTGIFLDSMKNEVILVYENDKPSYYKSEIFTPVCNTGECLPVYIDIYWNLQGDYLKFNQPKGEILTKLDHQAFSPADYELLDEILRGPDPRMSIPQPVKNQAQANNDQLDSQANPAPTVAIQVDKHLMVDGISGATLPQIQTRFVPGALYTTYTLWGLAHDAKFKMRTYSHDKLYQDHALFLLKKSTSAGQMDIISYLTSKEKRANPRAQVLVDIIETGDTVLQEIALSQLYYNYNNLLIVQTALDHAFYSTPSKSVQRGVIKKWGFNYCTPDALSKLSKNLLLYEDLFSEIMAAFKNKISYTADFTLNLMQAYPQLKAENQKEIIVFYIERREYFSQDDLELIENLK